MVMIAVAAVCAPAGGSWADRTVVRAGAEAARPARHPDRREATPR